MEKATNRGDGGDIHALFGLRGMRDVDAEDEGGHSDEVLVRDAVSHETRVDSAKLHVQLHLSSSSLEGGRP